MIKKERLLIMENRLNKLRKSEKNTNSPGVARKLERKILRLKQS